MAWSHFMETVFQSSADTGNGSTNDSTDCNSNRRNQTFVFYDGYLGIPQNIIINVCSWLVLLILFSILRKNAWNYGRIALVQRNEQRRLLHKYEKYNVWTQLFYGDVDAGQTVRVNNTPDQESVESQGGVNNAVDQGFFSWITAIFRVKDEVILRRSGPDAIQYLSFQRYLIAYCFLLTFISLVIVLPVNFQGDVEGDYKAFGHTTLSNLDPNSPLLWIHVILSILLFPVIICFMRHFSVNLRFEEHTTQAAELAQVSRTLMIIDIPKDFCTKSMLLKHFQEAYPEAIIQDIQLAFNIRELMRLSKRKEAIHDAKLWAEAYLKDTGKRLNIYPCMCSWLVSCCGGCGCPLEDAVTYYSQKENELTFAVDGEETASMEKPLGICFITFQSEQTAYRIYKDHQHTCRCGLNPPTSSVSRHLEPYRWAVSNAPVPDDIVWQNLSANSEHWYLRAFCINFFLFFVLFFVTTPFVVITSLDVLNVVDFVNKLNPILASFLPTLLLWTVAALMPVLVSYSDQFVRHWTRSNENHTIMRKTFIFLLFMIIILPSLGLTSAKAFVEWALMTKSKTMRWKCVFLPDNGAFYVNYVTTSAFIGSALELIRFPELFMYVARLCATRSVAERSSVRKAILWEFPFGTQYAWFLLGFATTAIYSISCPLIAPFGLVYVCLKHCVDRYNIIFAYGPSKINKNIHATAINFVVASILLLQMNVLFFMFLRRGLANITIFSIAFFCLTAVVYIGQLFFNLFKGFSPILYTRFKGDPDKTDDTPTTSSAATDFASPSHVRFLPGVLHRRRGGGGGGGGGDTGTDGITNLPSSAQQQLQRSYGTTTEEGNITAEEVEIEQHTSSEDEEEDRQTGGLDGRTQSALSPLTAVQKPNSVSPAAAAAAANSNGHHRLYQNYEPSAANGRADGADGDDVLLHLQRQHKVELNEGDLMPQPI